MRVERKWKLFFAGVFCIACVLFSSVQAGAEGMVKIDANKKYKGMNASFARGYAPSIKNDTMRLVIPFRTDEAVGKESILVGVTFEREENSPFYFKNYQKQVKPSANGVYLYKCKIRLRKNRINGQYPLHLFALAKTADGNVREEFTIYAEITDGRETLAPEEEIMGDGSSLDLQKAADAPSSDAKEKVIRQPRILLEKNDLQGREIPAGGSVFWTLTAKNCSGSQTVENMKVTLQSESADVSFEKRSWYFERIEPGGEMTLSQNIAAEQIAAADFVPVQLQFEYEDKKGTAYTASETVYLSVAKTQEAKLVNFMMPESFSESDTETVAFQVQNTGFAALYNVRVFLEGKGLFAQEAFLGNIEPQTALDGELQIFAGTLNMDAQGEITDESAEKYGDVSGRVIFSYENEQGELTTQEQEYKTSIKKPQTVNLTIEEPEKQETNQWWITIAIMGFLAMLFAILWLYLRMRHYQRMGREYYEKSQYL